MKTNEKVIDGREIYLVIDPRMEEAMLLKKLSTIVTEGISAVQIWDNFRRGENVKELIAKIQAVCKPHNIPLLINNQWEYLIYSELDGVHFDLIPNSINFIRNKIKRKFTVGLTCGNDLRSVEWASRNDIDYISFCAMFPSVSAAACEIVTHETVQKARTMFKKPVFLAGGIYPENLTALRDLDFDGIAVISGLMNADQPGKRVEEYQNNLKKLK